MITINVKEIYELHKEDWDEMSLNMTPSLNVTISNILNISGGIGNLVIIQDDKKFEGGVRDAYVDFLNFLCTNDKNIETLKKENVILMNPRNSDFVRILL